jgi:single-strand DNA-binding protein
VAAVTFGHEDEQSNRSEPPVNYNRVIIGGNLTRDIELRYTASGVAVGHFGIAVNERWTDGNGQPQERVNFFDCDAFNKTAETMAQYLKKGDPVLVEGRLKQDSWQDKASGENRYKVKIAVQSFQFCSVKRDDSAPRARQAPRQEPASAPADNGGYGADADDGSDVPF